jgi:glyoxylate/hydroxypyruvate reductase
MTLVYKADPVRGAEWAKILTVRGADLDFRIWPDIGNPLDVRYLATWILSDNIVQSFPNLEVLFSLGAGVDQIDFSKLPAELPVVRMVEPGIIDGMIEYVCMAVLALHRDLLPYMAQQREHVWRPIRVRPAASRRVGVLGLGVLGQAACRKLSGFGFQVSGWSRSSRSLEGVECFAGHDALPAFLERCDVLVCLLPLTTETRGLIDANVLSRLPYGAKLVNAARGALLDQDALLAALHSGHIAAAVLDVASPEPLPPGHALWEHPMVMVTPHIASMTQPESAVDTLLDNLARHRSGEPLIGLVDRARGY